MAGTRKPRSRILRGIYLVLGLICLGLAYMSWLPGIPTFDFVMLAAFFFARSSDRFHDWLISHPIFGRIIAGYREGGFTDQSQNLDLGGAGGFARTIDRCVNRLDGVSRAILAAVGAFALWFIWTPPTRPSGNSEPRVTTHVERGL